MNQLVPRADTPKAATPSSTYITSAAYVPLSSRNVTPPQTTKKTRCIYYSSCGEYVKEIETVGSPMLTRFPLAHSTDVVLCSLCPPRRWSDAGVGIGMLRGSPVLSAI